MKKFFMMLTAFAAAFMVSCGNDDPQGPDDTTPGGSTSGVSITEATYYGEQLGAGAGYYVIELNSGNDRLRLALFSNVAAVTDSPRLTIGDYTLSDYVYEGEGTIETRTFFSATSTDDENGSLFWQNGTPMLITGGTVNVASIGNVYTIRINLECGDTPVEWTYTGNLTIDDQRVIAPRTPITADEFMMQYIGQYNLADEPLGQVLLVMGDSSAPNTYIQIVMTVPLPEDADYAEIPTGTIEVATTPDGPYMVWAGGEDNDTGSMEYTTAANVVTNGAFIEEGSMTITDNGDGTYDVHTNFRGHNFVVSGNELSIGEMTNGDIEYILDNAAFPEHPIDVTRPQSFLTENVTLPEMPNSYIDVWAIDQNQTQLLWRVIFSTADIVISEGSSYQTDGALMLSQNEGTILGLQLVTPGSTSIPDGTYEVSADNVYQNNTVLPAYIYAGDLLGLANGSWYVVCEVRDGEFGIGGAGAMPEQGQVTFSAIDEDTLQAEVELYDKHGYSITGTVQFDIPTSTASLSSRKALPVMNRTAEIPGFQPYQPIEHTLNMR